MDTPRPQAPSRDGCKPFGDDPPARGGRDGARSAARSVPRHGAVADIPRPHSRKRRELVHHPQLRLQRRDRNLHLHFRLHRSLRLRPGHARARLLDLERAHPQTRLADLCGAHLSVHDLHGRDRLRGGDIRQPALRRGNEHSRFPQAARHHDLPGAVVEIQAGQYGRAAALHRPVAAVPAHAATAAVATGLRTGGLGLGLCAGLEIRLESARLSERRVVLQSVRLAIAVRVRRLVRARRSASALGPAALAHRAFDRRGLPAVRLRDRLDLVFRAARPFRADLAERCDISDRQDQSRCAALCAFPRARGGDGQVRAAPLAGAEMADPATGHPLRAAFAGNLLPRRVSGLCRAIHHRRMVGRPAGADGDQPVRHFDHDCDSEPVIMVQEDRRTKSPLRVKSPDADLAGGEA